MGDVPPMLLRPSATQELQTSRCQMTKKPKEPHPTIFVLEGSIRWYKDGSMLELHAQVTPEEWAIIVDETIKYKLFIECLKQTACPILEEAWTEEDEWFRLQLDVAVSRIRNLDPLLVAKYDQKQILSEYTNQAKKNAQLAKAGIEQIRQEQAATLKAMLESGDNDTTKVSDL